MASKKKGQADASKFEGTGISFKAKLIGIEEVAEARGDLLCQEAITKLKNSVKASGQHKQKILVNVSLEGLKIIDAISLLVLHNHAVHRISFISRDTTDNRAFGYIMGSGDGKHTFFAIKTAAAAEQLVLTLRDLFQVVYEMKTKEVKEAKEKLEEKSEEPSAENEKPSGEGSTSEEDKTQTTEAQAAEGDGVYQGIEQIKNLDFDSLNDGEKSPVSPMSPAPPTSGTADPWAVPATTSPTANTANTANSSLGDLAGIQTGPFVNMPQQQPFPGGPFPAQTVGYNIAGVPGYNMPNAGLPVTRDPFGSDPFNANYRQPVPQPGFGAPGFPAANMFGGPGFSQPYQGGVRPPMPGMTPPAGMFPAAPTAASQNPFANNTAPEDPNMLKPIRKDQAGQDAALEQEKAGKAPKGDLFGDLLGMKKSTNDAKTPKDMFAQLSAADKKSMNQMKQMNDMPPKASFDNSDPFLDIGNVLEDKRRGLIQSEVEDPFDTSHVTPMPIIHRASSNPSPSTLSVPPVPQRLSPAQNQISHKPSCPSPSMSSSSSSPVPLSNQPPLLAPPPLPNRIRNNCSSSVAPLSSPDKKTVASDSSDPPSFVHPSPDEPPPPLPQEFIRSPAAPPPPPRPASSKSLSSMSSNTPCSSEPCSLSSSSISPPQSSTQMSTSSCLSSSTSSSDSLQKASPSSAKSINKPKPKSDLSFSSTDLDPFSIPLKSSNHTEVSRNKHNNNSNHSDKTSHNSHSLSGSTGVLDNDKAYLSKPSSSDLNSTQSVISNPFPDAEPSTEGVNRDPFGIPMHPAPDFKAVATFGNDPFEDSFGASTNYNEQDLAQWDPFPDTPSPFENSASRKVNSNDPWA